MKHLFFVSVAVGIFSGTFICAKAQVSVNLMRLNQNDVPAKNQVTFIEGIEIKPEAATPVATIPVNITPSLQNTSTGKAIGVAIENCSAIQFKFAQLMNTEVETLTNFKLYAFIDEWWATRYRYGGTTKNGIDCSAYSGTLLKEVFGITVPRTARNQYGICEKINREDLVEGDLVFFNTRGGVSHVGVYLGNGYFTHSSTHNGITINHLDEKYYSKKFIGGGRFIPQSEN